MKHLLFAAFTAAGMAFTCGALGATRPTSAVAASATRQTDGARPVVVATAFPHYDWTRQIIGDRYDAVELVLLQQSGADLHSYRPTARDIKRIATCDLFVYVGGESDEWAEAVLKENANANRRELNLLKALGDRAKEEAEVEGAEPERHGDDHDGGDEGEELDEHIWLSLRNAAALAPAIADALAALDPGGAEVYRANAKRYAGELAALDREYADAVKNAARRVILVADRFPLRYLADDYGLKAYAAFSGCSAESEASFKTIAFLAKKVDALGLPVILTLEGSRHKVAESVRGATKSRNQRIVAIDSLQSVTGEKAKTATYLEAMRGNLDALKAALR